MKLLHAILGLIRSNHLDVLRRSAQVQQIVLSEYGALGLHARELAMGARKIALARSHRRQTMERLALALSPKSRNAIGTLAQLAPSKIATSTSGLIGQLATHNYYRHSMVRRGEHKTERARSNSLRLMEVLHAIRKLLQKYEKEPQLIVRRCLESIAYGPIGKHGVHAAKLVALMQFGVAKE